MMLPTWVFASALPDFPFIGVQGEAEIEVQPDVANIGFRLVEFSEDSDKALDAIRQRSAQVIEIARSLEIPNDAVISLGIDNEIERQINREKGYNKTNILGYEVSQSFSIKVENLTNYPKLVDKLVSIGNVGRITPRFDVSNRKEIERSLVAEAGKDAKQKAEDLASAMGVKIKSVFAITQDASFEHFFAKFGLQEQAPMGDLRASIAYDRAGGSMNMMIPKAIEIKKKISVVYKIK